jgi:hypothetical protein
MVGMGAGLAMGQQMTNSMNNINTPPPLPKQIAQYYIALNDKQEGPFSLEQIQTYINDATIMKQTLVWTQGMQDWEEAESVLNQHFTQTPPPLP